MQLGHELVLQERIRDIATKGFSTIDVPKVGNKPPARKIESAITMICDAIGHHEAYLGGLARRIHHAVRLMERLYGKDDKMAVSTMQKIKIIQREFVHVLRVIAGLKAYELHVTLGHLGTKNVQKTLKEIENARWNNKPSTAGKDALVVMVKEQRYFPVMTSSGKIRFSSQPPAFGSDNGSFSEGSFITTSTQSTDTVKQQDQ